MPDAPHFSVIIPTLHEEAAIAGTLDSIRRAGNGFRTETIVVDGGSSDRTLDIASNFTQNIHVLDSRGIGTARNFGARQANGDILVFLDSDTIVPSNFFYQLSRVFSDPEVCGANCNVMPHEESAPSRVEKSFYRAWGAARRGFYRVKPCGTGDNAIIIRRDAFRRSGGFDESMRTMEDLDFIFRASRLGRFMFLRDVTLKESMRRLRRVGVVRFSWIYLNNFFYYLAKGRPRINSWEPMR